MEAVSILRNVRTQGALYDPSVQNNRSARLFAQVEFAGRVQCKRLIGHSDTSLLVCLRPFTFTRLKKAAAPVMNAISEEIDALSKIQTQLAL